MSEENNEKNIMFEIKEGDFVMYAERHNWGGSETCTLCGNEFKQNCFSISLRTPTFSVSDICPNCLKDRAYIPKALEYQATALIERGERLQEIANEFDKIPASVWIDYDLYNQCWDQRTQEIINGDDELDELDEIESQAFPLF